MSNLQDGLHAILVTNWPVPGVILPNVVVGYYNNTLYGKKIDISQPRIEHLKPLPKFGDASHEIHHKLAALLQGHNKQSNLNAVRDWR
jgi:hypothetical protein